MCIRDSRYGFEPGVIWRRDRLPTITVRANVYGEIQPATVTAQIEPSLAPVRAKLPPGFRLETGGTVEESAKGQRSVAAGVPLFVLVVLTILMVQLQNISRVVMAVSYTHLDVYKRQDLRLPASRSGG